MASYQRVAELGRKLKNLRDGIGHYKELIKYMEEMCSIAKAELLEFNMR